ncbi:monofunctional biosynthetic peptidoglycan transglycosylase [Caballeronia sp. LZ062]|uniref:monofunctional biosynthetic peptidoglycan transglycosylase n=1 Tax=unclassified Caballeronia TaxID=2646786 RepID=UPI00285C203C|nr:MULTISPECIES: monofunctional biosynthetic peptidoglycan transglycosylase [unclassified Caballeronia]MDR5855414.1 monofunctional biosynthetic peptidoglycan transglycosylase [Caballeronia sp. LZ050]MDR5870058.1 monofunctional biosynthetic peptidoglycan transglycosylase [Caballeronia sp. LZ062]
MTAAPGRSRNAPTDRPARRAARLGPARWIAYGVSVIFIAFLATQLYFFLQIGVWTATNPGSTAFMRADAWTLAKTHPGIVLQRTWVPYDQISRNLKRAIIASEDANFVNNNGYETDAILQAWEKNKSRGKIVAGGSTISQQLARNLFLSREKSYIRKAQELVITWMLEFCWTKERIFEVYLNSVEWGNGVYGAEAAAHYYYKTSAAKLTAGQSARLAVMLPRPKYFDDHRNSPYLTARARVIARRMGAAELPE